MGVSLVGEKQGKEHASSVCGAGSLKEVKNAQKQQSKEKYRDLKMFQDEGNVSKWANERLPHTRTP